ncbi:Regulator of chromosome condensation (RCC1) repeat protein [compost metagenome]
MLSWGETYQPAPAPGLKDVVDIVEGYDSYNVLKKDGTVWTFDIDYSSGGRLEAKTNPHWTEPKQVGGLEDVVAIKGSFGHTVAVKKDGTVWAWGRNSGGQLGDETVISHENPVQVKLN